MRSLLQRGGGKTVKTCFAALGLEFSELTESFLHGPVQALFADAEVYESFGMVAEGTGGGRQQTGISVLTACASLPGRDDNHRSSRARGVLAGI